MNAYQYDGEMPVKVAAQLKRKAKDEMHYDSDLAYGLDFTADDLAANREGVFTERQLASMRRNTATDILYGVTAAIPVGVLILIFGHSGQEPVINRQEFTGLLTALMFGYAGIAPILWDRSKAYKEKLKIEGVESLSGRVILDTPPFFRLTIGQQRFKLRRQAYLRFKHLDYYTVYYVPRSKVILSAEPMME